MARKWVISCETCKITKQCANDQELKDTCTLLQKAVTEAQKFWMETQIPKEE